MSDSAPSPNWPRRFEVEPDSEPDTTRMLSLVRNMRRILSALEAGQVPNRSDFTLQDLTAYCESLVRGQRGSLGRTVEGSWSVASHDMGMPSDARVDFIFMPTYIAVAILSRVMQDRPSISRKIPGYVKAMRTGMQFCLHRGLRAHGYDAEEGLFEAVRILSEGRVPDLLALDPGLCPELRLLLDQIEVDCARALREGETAGPFGTDLREGYREVVRALSVLRSSQAPAATLD